MSTVTEVRSGVITRPRNVYLDTLRVIALGRVVLLHSFFVGWTSFLVPSMGIMFALGGSLTAASLSRSKPGAVFAKRGVRVLIPFWAYGVVAVVAMLIGGWRDESATAFSLTTLTAWAAPVTAPIGSMQWDLLWRPLWYLSTYLWFVALTPLLFRLYKRSPLATVVSAVVLGAAVPAEVLKAQGVVGSSVLDFCCYLGFWILGFAHHEGHLQRVSAKAIAVVSAVSFGIAVAAIAILRDGRLELTMHPVINMAWSLPFMLVLLRWNPSMAWLDARPRVARFISAVNSRAITFYLWHTVAILVAVAATTALLGTDGRVVSASFVLVQLPITAALLFVLVLTFGPIEDRAKRIASGFTRSR